MRSVAPFGLPGLSVRRGEMAILLVVAGCGPAAVPMVELSGEVAYEGRAIPQGTVSFVPADGAGPPALLAITDGRYAGRVPAGGKRVEIRGLRPAARPRPSTGGPGADEAEAVESFIPSKYNDQSGLSREIAPPGPVRIDFALEK
jgi:hypothetical protein